MFSKHPKSLQTFGLLLKDNLTQRTFKNHPIWSHCCDYLLEDKIIVDHFAYHKYDLSKDLVCSKNLFESGSCSNGFCPKVSSLGPKKKIQKDKLVSASKMLIS